MPYEFKKKSARVEFRDGKKLVAVLIVTQADYAADMLLAELEFKAVSEYAKLLEERKSQKKFVTGEEVRFNYFSEKIYPKLAAPTVTNDGSPIPTAAEAYKLPSKCLNDWYAAAEKTNPAWFDEFKQITKAALDAIEKLPSTDPAYVRLKKKEKNPAK